MDIWHAKFQVDIAIFGKLMAQKPHPLMTSFFETAILSISSHRTETKMVFLESWDQIGSETHIFYSKIPIWKFDRRWPEVNSALLCRWLAWAAKLLNGFDFWIIRAKVTVKSCVACPKKECLTLVTFHDLSWPDLDPCPYLHTMTLKLTGQYLQ